MLFPTLQMGVEGEVGPHWTLTILCGSSNPMYVASREYAHFCLVCLWTRPIAQLSSQWINLVSHAVFVLGLYWLTDLAYLGWHTWIIVCFKWNMKHMKISLYILSLFEKTHEFSEESCLLPTWVWKGFADVVNEFSVHRYARLTRVGACM